MDTAMTVNVSFSVEDKVFKHHQRNGSRTAPFQRRHPESDCRPEQGWHKTEKI